ncbi:MAG: hypothetical protein AAFN91_08505 [Pseudomonadota bacterium]
MTAANIRRYPSTPDVTITNIIEHLLEEELIDEAVFTFPGNIRSSASSTEGLAKVIEDRKIDHGKIIQKANITVIADHPSNNMQIEFRRAVTEHLASGNQPKVIHTPSQFECEIEVLKPGANLDETYSIFLLFEDRMTLGTTNGAAAIPNDILKAIAAQVEALGAASNKLYDDARSVRKDTEKELANLRKKQNTEFAAKQKEVEEEHERQLKALKEREAELEKRIAAVDDRDNMHARRAKAQQIAEQLNQRLKEPSIRKDVLRTRNLITRMSLAALTISGFIVFTGLIEFVPNLNSGSNLNSMIFAGARVAGGSAAFFLVLFYLLSFLKRIAEEDAATKHQLERYSLDMDRSSWAIETVLEAQARGDATEVPDEWLRGVTNNLFGGSKTEDEDKTALEALGEILQRGAAFKVGSNGVEIDLSAKAAKKVGKTGTE